MRLDAVHDRGWPVIARDAARPSLRLNWRRVLALGFNVGVWALLIAVARAALSK